METTKRHIFAGTLALIVVALGLPAVAPAQSKVGTTAATFLGIGIGPRGISMGGAYVASHEDATLLYWNPGAVVQTKRSEFVFSNTEWLVGTKLRWFGLVLNIAEDNAIGVGLTQLDYGEEDVNTVANPEGTGERWSAKDYAVGLTYSRRLTDRFSIGGTVKYINQRVYNETASTWAFDAGLLFDTGFHNLRLGMSMTNFGGSMKMEGQDLLQRVDIDPANAGSNKTLVGSLKTDPWPIPLMFRVGLAMDVVKNEMFRATAAVDAIRPSDNADRVNVGAELGFREMVFVRGGYQSLFGKESAWNRDNLQEGLTFGAGLRYQIEGIAALEVNYALMKFGLFGNLNTIALAIGF